MGFLLIIVFVLVFSVEASQQPALSPQAEHAWLLVESGIVLFGAAFGLVLVVKIFRAWR